MIEARRWYGKFAGILQVEIRQWVSRVRMLIIVACEGTMRSKLCQHFVYLSVHLSRPCWMDGSSLISMRGLSHVEDTFCLYVASLLVKLRPIE